MTLCVIAIALSGTPFHTTAAVIEYMPAVDAAPKK